MARVNDPVTSVRRRLRIGEGIEGAIIGVGSAIGQAISQKIKGTQLTEAERKKNELMLKVLGIEHANKKELQLLSNELSRSSNIRGNQTQLLIAKLRDLGQTRRTALNIRFRRDKQDTKDLKNVDIKTISNIQRHLDKINKDVEFGARRQFADIFDPAKVTAEEIQILITSMQQLEDDLGSMNNEFLNKNAVRKELNDTFKLVGDAVTIRPELMEGIPLNRILSLSPTVLGFGGQDAVRGFNVVVGTKRQLEGGAELKGVVEQQRLTGGQKLETVSPSEGKGFLSSITTLITEGARVAPSFGVEGNQFTVSTGRTSLFGSGRKFIVAPKGGGKGSETTFSVDSQEEMDFWTPIITSLGTSAEAKATTDILAGWKKIGETINKIKDDLIQQNPNHPDPFGVAMQTLTDKQRDIFRQGQGLEKKARTIKSKPQASAMKKFIVGGITAGTIQNDPQSISDAVRNRLTSLEENPDRFDLQTLVE